MMKKLPFAARLLVTVSLAAICAPIAVDAWINRPSDQENALRLPDVVKIPQGDAIIGEIHFLLDAVEVTGERRPLKSQKRVVQCRTRDLVQGSGKVRECGPMMAGR